MLPSRTHMTTTKDQQKKKKIRGAEDTQSSSSSSSSTVTKRKKKASSSGVEGETHPSRRQQLSGIVSIKKEEVEESDAGSMRLASISTTGAMIAAARSISAFAASSSSSAATLVMADGKPPAVLPQLPAAASSYIPLPQGFHVGCSGYSYKHWHVDPQRPKNFYAFKGVKKEYDHYASVFNALEINYTFYHMPSEKSITRWKEQIPREDFVYTLKAHRYFTHTKRSNVDEWFIKKWEVFWARCCLFGPSLGCVLFQFPNGFKQTPATLSRIENLGQYLSTNCPTGRFAIEFRDVSWFNQEVYDVLQRYDLCLCAIDVNTPKLKLNEKRTSWGDLPSGSYPPMNQYPFQSCSWTAYTRFHGTGQPPSTGSYGSLVLQSWAKVAWQWRHGTIDVDQPDLDSNQHKRRVFIFFNNDASMDEEMELPSAVADAKRIGQALIEISATTTTTITTKPSDMEDA